MLLQPWPISAVPCVDVPLAQPQAPGKHQVSFRRGEVGPPPSTVLSTVTWAPRQLGLLYLEPQRGPPPASDLALLTSSKDHQQSKPLALPKK